jgi:hypothetical protein
VPSLPRIQVWWDWQRRSTRHGGKGGAKRIDVIARLVHFLRQTAVKMQGEGVVSG